MGLNCIRATDGAFALLPRASLAMVGVRILNAVPRWSDFGVAGAKMEQVFRAGPPDENWNRQIRGRDDKLLSVGGSAAVTRDDLVPFVVNCDVELSGAARRGFLYETSLDDIDLHHLPDKCGLKKIP